MELRKKIKKKYGLGIFILVLHTYYGGRIPDQEKKIFFIMGNVEEYVRKKIKKLKTGHSLAGWVTENGKVIKEITNK